jgi:hypothetical protein
MLGHEAALIYAMVVATGADREITHEEIDLIGDLVDHLPIFCAIDRARVTELATACSKLLSEPGGIEQVYAQIRAALAGRLREAAYALSCDVIALDDRLRRDAMQALERIRVLLEIDLAKARTIERAARGRSRAA